MYNKISCWLFGSLTLLLVSCVFMSAFTTRFIENKEKTCQFIGHTVITGNCYNLNCTSCACHSKISCNEAISMNISTICCGEPCNNYYKEYCYLDLYTCYTVLSFYTDGSRNFYINTTCDDSTCVSDTERQYNETRSCWNGEFSNPHSILSYGIFMGLFVMMSIVGCSIMYIKLQYHLNITREPLLS